MHRTIAQLHLRAEIEPVKDVPRPILTSWISRILKIHDFDEKIEIFTFSRRWKVHAKRLK